MNYYTIVIIIVSVSNF